MSPFGFCPNCRSVRSLGEFREGDQPAFWCETCGRPVAPSHADRESLSTRPPLILCIDDDRLLLHLFSDALERVGFRTAIAPDGPTGLEVARRERPALILLDYMMPRMDGLEVCRRLRADPALRDVRIILLTAIDKPELVAEARKAGATITLGKPFGPESVVETIERLLGWKPGPIPF